MGHQRMQPVKRDVVQSLIGRCPNVPSGYKKITGEGNYFPTAVPCRNDLGIYLEGGAGTIRKAAHPIRDERRLKHGGDPRPSIRGMRRRFPPGAGAESRAGSGGRRRDGGAMRAPLAGAPRPRAGGGGAGAGGRLQRRGDRRATGLRGAVDQAQAATDPWPLGKGTTALTRPMSSTRASLASTLARHNSCPSHELPTSRARVLLIPYNKGKLPPPSWAGGPRTWEC